MIDNASAISNFTAKRNFFFFNYQIILPNEQWYFLWNVLVLLEKAKTFFFFGGKNPLELGIEQTVIFPMKCISLIGKSKNFFFVFLEKSSWTWYRTKFFPDYEDEIMKRIWKDTRDQEYVWNQLIYIIFFLKSFIFTNIYVKCVTKIWS